MSCRVVTTNLLKAAVVTMAPAADQDFPERFLFDGPGQLGAIFSDLTADPTVTVDLSVAVAYGDGFGPDAVSGATIATAPALGKPQIATDWTVVPANPSDTGYLNLLPDADLGFIASDHGGNGWSLALAGNLGAMTAKYPLVAKAGGSYRVEGWAVNGNGSSNAAAIRLFDPFTGRYLKTDGTWDPSPQDLVLDSTTDHAWLGIGSGSGVTFAVASADDLGADEVSLELQLLNGDVGFAFFDDLALVQVLSADLLMVTGGHNINAAVTPTWEKSDDGASWTTVTTLTRARHQFWALLDSPVTARYHRLKLTGTPTVQTFIGDVVLALTTALARTPAEPVNVRYNELGQARLASPGGTEYVANRGPFPVRTVDLTFRFRTEAEEVAARAVLIDGLRGGENECVVFPSTKMFPRLAVYGRIQEGLTFNMAIQGTPLADATEAGALEHYSDLSLTVKEGPAFELE